MKGWLLALLALASCASATTDSPALRLDFEGGTCSGTAVGPDVVLTAAHCFQAGRLVGINGKPAYALKRVDDGNDHSLIRVNVKLRSYVWQRQAVEVGEPVHWTGNPAGMGGVLRRGYVAGVVDGIVLIDAHSFGGDSGAGVFNNAGRLVAVVSGIRYWTHGPYVFALSYAEPLAFTPAQWKEMG